MEPAYFLWMSVFFVAYEDEGDLYLDSALDRELLPSRGLLNDNKRMMSFFNGPIKLLI